MPVPGMRRTEPQWRNLRQTAMVGVSLSVAITRIVGIVEKPDVGLFIERDLNDIVTS
jgi:hypothetical protein